MECLSIYPDIFFQDAKYFAVSLATADRQEKTVLLRDLLEYKK
jgi:hypothetical protein